MCPVGMSTETEQRDEVAPVAVSGLAALRQKLDAIDDQVHDLLMQRARVVEDVARDAAKSGIKIRPGREASILRRLLGRHAGAMPAQAIFRFWREMFAAALVIEGGQTVAVCAGADETDLPALAREHFGALTPVRKHRNPAQALADIERGTAQVAVLPPPAEDGEGGWWTSLGTGRRQLSVIARLPFWTRRGEGLPAGEAYVVATIRPDPSGADHGLIAFEMSADISRGKILGNLAAAGFVTFQAWLRRDSGESPVVVLVEVEGLVEDDDPRLTQIAGLDQAAWVIGGFAVPLN
jgi:chorismate mutase/prephenate dehydratase